VPRKRRKRPGSAESALEAHWKRAGSALEAPEVPEAPEAPEVPEAPVASEAPEAPEAEAISVEVEALKILALPHHC
jgi:pyochelin synthetase